MYELLIEYKQVLAILGVVALLGLSYGVYRFMKYMVNDWYDHWKGY